MAKEKTEEFRLEDVHPDLAGLVLGMDEELESENRPSAQQT